MKRILTALCVVALALCSPAQAQFLSTGYGHGGVIGSSPSIATPITILASPFGTAFNSGSASSAVTANVPIGSFIFLDIPPSNNNDTVTAVTDGGNTYTIVNSAVIAGWSTASYAYVSSSTHALTSGSSTFTVTTSDAGQWFIGAVYSNTNSGADKSFTVNAGTTATTWSQASGTLAQSAELALGGCNLGTTPYVTSPGFTTAGASVSGFTGFDYKITSVVTTFTFAPTWPSGGFSCFLASFKL